MPSIEQLGLATLILNELVQQNLLVSDRRDTYTDQVYRGDRAALQAYLDRINQRPLKIIARPGDPDFDEKVQAAIRQKLEKATSSDRI